MGYIEELRALVGHRRLILAGASCVVRSRDGKLLLQQRVYPEGRWCFPGGLMELGESVEDTARREVRGLARGRRARRHWRKAIGSYARQACLPAVSI